tara:strand:+ start:3943 stop:4641 length:699 start_codon:yes stop_codon:yes gene_type:complete
MSNKFDVSEAFGPDHAANYDAQFEKLHPIKDVMHLVLQAHLGELPDTARILVAGAGTGAEVRHLAAIYPNWQFTLVDPSEAMLAVARQHAQAEGFEARCTFRAAYVSAIPDKDFDAATSMLVSHFLTGAEERTAYFRSIAERLKPGAPVFNADLCYDTDAPDFPAVRDFWLSLMSRAGMNAEGRERYKEMFGTLFACHGPAEVEAMMESAGFVPPAQCMQAGLIRGWVTAKA